MRVSPILSASADLGWQTACAWRDSGFSPSGETGEGFGVGTFPRLALWFAVLTCPFPEGKGIVLSPILSAGADVCEASTFAWGRF